MAAVKAIPEGYGTVTPFLSVKQTAKLIDFLKSAFGAQEVMRMPGPGGMVMHAEINIGNSRLMLSEATQAAPSSSSFYLYVNDVDAQYQ
ncbi:MAG TPA: VOC family protein, partial [Candidatus Binataceae bacterium]